MPHLILEVSRNLDNRHVSKKLFEAIKQLLVESLPTSLSNFKCRLYVPDEINIGDQLTHQEFVHLTIKILPGRDHKKLNEVTQTCFNTLEQIIDDAFPEMSIKKSLELLELSQFYLKN